MEYIVPPARAVQAALDSVTSPNTRRPYQRTMLNFRAGATPNSTASSTWRLCGGTRQTNLGVLCPSVHNYMSRRTVASIYDEGERTAYRRPRRLVLRSEFEALRESGRAGIAPRP